MIDKGLITPTLKKSKTIKQNDLQSINSIKEEQEQQEQDSDEIQEPSENNNLSEDDFDIV